MRLTNRDAFVSRLRVSPGGCWEWAGSKLNNGYGKASFRNRTIGAHRLAWILMVGPIPDGLCILHKCDNKPCCNPGHLYVGTHADNARDCVDRGRRPPLPPEKLGLSRAYGDSNGSRKYPERLWRGEKAVGAKLTEEKVRIIRKRLAAGELQRTIAADFGVTQSLISYLARGKTWRHVT